MPPRSLILCAQCGAVVESEPLGLGDELFCCLGCVGGGPCICDRQDQDMLTLRVGPFGTQADLLRFAARLERAPGLLQVEMTHPDLADARFTAVAPSPDVLALAVEANPDFTITVETSGSSVFGRVAPPRRPRATSSADELLPSRTRFRVFRAANDAAGAFVDAPTRPEYTGREPRRSALPAGGEAAADLLSNARAAASMRTFAPQPERDAHTPPPLQPLAADAPPATISIIASTFSSFLALNEFQGAVRALPGVRDTRVRRFFGGTLNLSVEYEDAVPLAERLQAASDGGWVITGGAPDRVDLRLVGALSSVSGS